MIVKMSFFLAPALSYQWMSITLATLPLSYLLTYAVYQLLLSSLASIPGPLWAKLTPFWLTSQCRSTERSRAVVAMHKKYGDFVRIAPNHISINKPEALAQIYGHKSGFIKGPFYDAFVQVQPVVFTARDVAVHQRKRKYLNSAFSSRGLADFEPYMDAEIRDLITKLDMMCGAKQTVDFCVWSTSIYAI
jgi:benzoate 4-monooxygenase